MLQDSIGSKSAAPGKSAACRPTGGRRDDDCGGRNGPDRRPSRNGKEYRFPALPKEVLAILNDGGFIPNVEKAVAQAKQ
jgi:hypothetical protein